MYMQLIPITLDVKSTVAAGDPSLVQHLIDKWVYISASFDATLVVEISPDNGATWEDIWTFTSAGNAEVPQSATHIRINTTAYVSGTPVAKLTGRNVQPGTR